MANKTTYEIIAKTKGFKNSEKQVKGLNGALGGLAKKAIGVAGAYFGTKMLLDGVRSSIDAFGEQELAEKKLEQALGKTSVALLNQASALQKVSIHGDEAIIAQQAFLASLDMSEKQIKDILPVAADLAAATGMTLESAVRNTAKTFSGLAGELGELVPQLRELTAEEMKAGDAVKVMAELFGGAASAEAETFTGKVTRVKNVLGDMAEDIGSKIAPTMGRLADMFLDTFENSEKALRILNTIRDDGIAMVEDQNFFLAAQVIQLDNLDVKMTKHIFNLEKVNMETLKFNEITGMQRAAILQLDKADLTSIYAGAVKDIGTATKAGAKTMKILTIAQAIADTYAGANKALAQGGMFGTASAVAITAAGLANVQQINQAYNQQNAQYGFEGVVTEPTQFTVGEGGANEYVSVTPLEGVNNAGGSGVTVNVTGNVMSEQFVEEELAERIAEAVRRGVDFGMS
tara:strand:+ start:5764 stop:7143 length:1380 start_codon:yes stop_codon:yes gene_type:complete